ncbi:MAG: hypothetical protein QM756_36680 [Polyangiaceae bacterium]
MPSVFQWVPFLLIPLVFGLMIYQRKKLSNAVAENADKSFGAVSQRMGLQVVEGDPNVNLLYFQQPMGNFKRTLTAQGRPYGRNARFMVIDGQKTSHYIVARTITTTFGCFLEVETPNNLPAFELCLRAPGQYFTPELEFADRPELHTASSGDPMLDQMFIVRAADVRMAPALIPALKLLSTQQVVHMAGEGQRIWMSIPRFGIAYITHVPEQLLLALESAACALEGRQQPASLGVAQPMVATA